MNLKKIKSKNLLLFFLILFSSHCFLFAQTQVTVLGKAPDYAEHTINLYTLTDPISEKKQTLAIVNIGADGSFHTTFDLENTTYIETEFDAYRASIYLNPGRSYELIFPPLKTVSPAQKRNPFFQYEVTSLATKNSDSEELNRQIQEFEIAYLTEETKYFNEIYHRQSEAAVDSLKNKLAKHFPKSENSYFESYKYYRIAFAEFALHREKPDNLIRKYFIDRQPKLDLPPCARLFQQLFTDQFTIEANQIQGANFRQLLATANLTGIENYFIANKGWDKNLSRLVILQSIKDAYGQGQFSPKSMKRLLDKIEHSLWKNQKKDIAKRLKEKLTYLEAGTNAPNFSMTDFKGEIHQLSEIKGHYVYLNFTRVSNPICRQHLDQLKKSATNLQQQLHIINLIMPEEASKKDLISQQGWAGEFYIVDEQAADKYKVSAFPMAYLINNNGTLILSPAANPLDGFEQQFVNLLKQQRIEEMRNQGK